MSDLPSSDPATDPALLGPEEPEPPQPPLPQIDAAPRAARASKTAQPGRAGARMRAAGIGLAVLGTCLAAAPHVSSAAARALAPLVAPELMGGVWIAGGLLLYIGGLLRRALAEIRGSIEAVGSETARLSELTRETHVMGGTVDRVQQANEELKLGVTGIQEQIERLTEIASDPNHTVSMFRLAASVDQLGARLDVVIKDQLKGMRQQLAEAIERTEQVGVELGRRISALGELVSEEHAAQQVALAERIEQTRAVAERAAAGIAASLNAAARIEMELATARETQERALESLGAEWTKGAHALNTQLQALGGHFDDRLEQQKGAMDQRLERIDVALERSGRERDELARELAARLGRELAAHSASLQQGVDSVADLARRAEQLGRGLNAMLAELGSVTAGQQESLQLALSEGIGRVHAVSAQTGMAAEENLKAAGRLEASLHDLREVSNQALASIHEAWSQDAAQRDTQAGELAAWLAHIAEVLASLSAPAAPSAPAVGEDPSRPEGPRERAPGRQESPGPEHERLDTPLLPGTAALHPEPPPALPASSDSPSDVIP